MTQHVAITDYDLPRDGRLEGILEQAGLTWQFYDCASEADVIAAASGADALIVQWSRITPSVVEAGPRLRIIGRLGTGCDMIDIGAASARGIVVANAGSYCAEEVAAHSVALAMHVLRGIGQLDRSVRDGQWSVATIVPKARRPSAATFGVVGFGRIGRRVAEMAAGVGFNVLVHDPYVDETDINGVAGPAVALEELLRRSDVVSLHAPLNDETRHLLDRKSLALLQKDAFVVNTCRGELIDENALAAALRAGQIAGAALDVFAQEPLPTDSPLRELPNVVLGPHAAWYSESALDDLPVFVATSVVDFLAGRPVSSIVNARELDATRA